MEENAALLGEDAVPGEPLPRGMASFNHADPAAAR